MPIMKYALPILLVCLGGCVYVEPASGPPAGGGVTDGPGADARWPDRSYLIRTAQGTCLDNSRSAYKGLIAHRCHGEGNQQFRFVQRSIRVEGLCLDVAGNRSDDGTPVIAYPCHGQSNQQWVVDGPTIRSVANGKCLDVGKHGNQVRIHRCDGSRGQDFSLSRR